MANYDASIRINTNISPDKIYNYQLNTESIERLRKSIERMERILTDSFNIQTTKQSVELLNKAAEDSFKKLSLVFEKCDYANMMKEIRFTVAEIYEKIGIKQLEILQNIDFGKLFKESFYQERYNEASDLAFEYIKEEIKGKENISQEELLGVFQEQIENKIGWQEKLYNKSEEFKRKYFVFYKIIVCTLLFFLNQIAIYFAQKGIAYVIGDMTSVPERNSSVIYYFDQRTEINIIGETDTHYFIIYSDNDGNESVGYCEKENVEIVPERDDETVEDTE